MTIFNDFKIFNLNFIKFLRILSLWILKFGNFLGNFFLYFHLLSKTLIATIMFDNIHLELYLIFESILESISNLFYELFSVNYLCCNLYITNQSSPHQFYTRDPDDGLRTSEIMTLNSMKLNGTLHLSR
jgi:hypothetical protein